MYREKYEILIAENLDVKGWIAKISFYDERFFFTIRILVKRKWLGNKIYPLYILYKVSTKNNEKITKEFIGALLNEKIESIVINEEKEILREYTNDKLGTLDLEAEINGKEKDEITQKISILILLQRLHI